MAKKLTLEEHADQIRDDLKVPHQSDVFKHAVEAGYLAARADGEVDANERTVLAKAVELLSRGSVIEWETETLLDECATRAEKDGAEARATNGVEKSEADVLKAIGKAAGLSADRVKTIVKRATDLEG